jgi:transcriptional regulator with XRE-family HTH domain
MRRSSAEHKILAGPTGATDIRGIVITAVEGFGGNQAALAAELGVTRATVSRWTSGRTVPDEGSCLRLAKLTGRAVVDVFQLAGRDTSLLPAEPELMADAAMAARLRQWARRVGALEAAERRIALKVLDDVVKSLCHRLGDAEARENRADAPKRARSRSGDTRSVAG